MKTPALIPWWLVGAAIVLVMLFVVPASVYAGIFDYEWTKVRPASIKPWLYVHALDVDSACRSFAGATSREGERINGCAQWKPVNCVIILPENAPAWIIEHEERHCMGEVHP